MPLKLLRNVSRFSSRSERAVDTWAKESLLATSSESFSNFLSDIESKWHRPSADQAILEDNLYDFDTKLPKRCLDGDYLAILKKTLDEHRPKQRLIPLTLGAAEKHPDLPRTTSPGFPWVHQGYKTKGEVLSDPAAVGKIHRAWDSIGRGVPWSLPDCLAFNRVIASEKEKTKVRPVWGFPTEVIVEEARYFYPLLEHLMGYVNETDACYGLGMETMKSGHAHLSRSATPGRLTLLSDLSRFDALVTGWIIRDIFSHISDWFDFSKVRDSEGKIWNVNPEQTCRRWKAMVSYFINTKIRTPRGIRVQKSSGVPSGSMFTNLMDTFVNAVQMRVSIRRVTGYLPVKDYYYGDDSAIFLDTPIDLDALAKVLLEVFGGVLSPSKTILSDNPENIQWLGYFHRTTGPRRSFDFIVASTLFPERPVDAPIESCARMLGQLYSCMDPKLCNVFYEAVRYLMDKYSISQDRLNTYVSQLPSKAFKYLVTLGLDISEISLPARHRDPFGGWYFPNLLPRPSPRNFVHTRDNNLPDYAFIPEAYCNRHLRNTGFHEFHKYTETFTFYDELHEDEAYFTD